MQTEILVSAAAAKIINMVQSAIAKSPTGVSFFSVKGYTNKEGEVSDYVINIGVDYNSAKEKDIETLRTLDLTKGQYKSPTALLETARTELINAFIKPNEAMSEGQIQAYTTITKNVKVHNETGVLYITGNKVAKKVLVPGVYKTVNSRPLTIAKDELRKQLRTDNIRQFILKEAKELKGAGETITLQY